LDRSTAEADRIVTNLEHILLVASLYGAIHPLPPATKRLMESHESKVVCEFVFLAEGALEEPSSVRFGRSDSKDLLLRIAALSPFVPLHTVVLCR